MRTRRGFALATLAAGAAVIAAWPALSQQAAAPIARYTIDAGTTSGMGAMAGGGNPLAALRGGGGGAVHELALRLGSTRAATGEPSGEHFMPQAAGLGSSVPLVTPRASVSPPGPETGMPSQAQMPKGRLLLFWGCGEHAPAGQPVIIDFAKMARGQVPPGLFAKGVNLPEDWSVTQANSRTFGEWPNDRDSKTVPANASLLGAHKITSTYAPDIAFTLADDFMPALQPTTQKLGSGATNLAWGALPKATGYYAWAMGANPDQQGDSRDMVWWSSAGTQQFGGALSEWLSPAAVARLIAAKTVMPPTQTSCTIPAEVHQAGGPMLMTQLFAYGPQADFAYPPRPASSRTPWKPDWIARVRFRANAMVMTGMPAMPGMPGGAGDDEDSGRDARSAPQNQPTGKPPCPRGLKGIALRAAGACA